MASVGIASPMVVAVAVAVDVGKGKPSSPRMAPLMHDAAAAGCRECARGGWKWKPLVARLLALQPLRGSSDLPMRHATMKSASFPSLVPFGLYFLNLNLNNNFFKK